MGYSRGRHAGEQDDREHRADQSGTPQWAHSDWSPGNVADGSFVFARGRVERRFASSAAEDEFARELARAEGAGLTGRQAMHAVLCWTAPHLVGQMRWVFMVGEVETFILAPRSRAELDLLIECARDVPAADDVDVVIGVQCAVTPPDGRDGQTIPSVTFDHLFPLSHAGLVRAIRADARRCARSKEVGDLEMVT